MKDIILKKLIKEELISLSYELISENINPENHYDYSRSRKNLWTFKDRTDIQHFIVIHKSLFKIEMEGMGELSKQVVNNKTGYSVNQGQRKELTPEEFADKKATTSTFDELLLLKKTDLILDGIEPINGADAYAIKNGKSTLYFDVKTGLKLAEIKLIEKGDKKMTVSTNYSDYREVNGVKVPFDIMINQGMELDFKMSEVKINEGVSDADFQ